jgi:hypothetical protein
MRKKMSIIELVLKRLNSISWIDYIGLFVVGLILFSLAFFFLRRGETVQVILRLSESSKVGFVGWEDRTPAWFLERLRPGLILSDRFGRPYMKIVDTYSFQAGDDMQVAYITLEFGAIYDKSSHHYLYNGIPLLVGTYHDFKIGDSEVKGVIYDVGREIKIANTKKVRVRGYVNPELNDKSALEAESISNGVKNYLADKFKVGLQSFDSKGQPIIEVVDVTVTQATRTVVDSNSGRVRSISDPDRKRVEAALEIKVDQFGQVLYYAKELQIKVGTDLWLSFDDLGTFFTITGIETVVDL